MHHPRAPPVIGPIPAGPVPSNPGISSPLFCRDLSTRSTTDQNAGLVLCLRHARVRTHVSTMLPDAASGRSGPRTWAERQEVPAAPAFPAARRSHKSVVQVRRAVSRRSIPRRDRSADPGLAALFHRILARHSPPSKINRIPAASLRLSERAGCALATWWIARSPAPDESGSNSVE